MCLQRLYSEAKRLEKIESSKAKELNSQGVHDRLNVSQAVVQMLSHQECGLYWGWRVGSRSTFNQAFLMNVFYSRKPRWSDDAGVMSPHGNEESELRGSRKDD